VEDFWRREREREREGEGVKKSMSELGDKSRGELENGSLTEHSNTCVDSR
jgi:hypothetical protein